MSCLVQFQFLPASQNQNVTLTSDFNFPIPGGGGVHQWEPKCHIDLRFTLSHSWGGGVHQWEPKCHIDLRFTLSHSWGGVGVGVEISGQCDISVLADVPQGTSEVTLTSFKFSNPEMKCLFLDYVQLLMISRAGRWTRIPSATPLQPKSEMLIFGLHSTSDDQPSNPSNESQPKCDKRPPKSSKNEILIFINYVQLLMIGQAIRVMKVDQNAKKWHVVSVRVFCCFS